MMVTEQKDEGKATPIAMILFDAVRNAIDM